MLPYLLAGFILGVLIALAAYRARALSRSGAVAAAVIGTIIFGLGQWPGAVLLLAFFISSSGLSRLFKRRKARFEEKFSKGSQRDAGQVLANGGVAAGFILVHALFPTAAWPWIGFAASLAAVNADTWATELGVLSRRPPRLITTGQIVEPGTSGAVSLWGTLVGWLGAAFIAVLGVLIFVLSGVLLWNPTAALALFALVSLAGLAGALFDSWLGATYQTIYTCPACQKETERHPRHLCGTPTVYRRGWRWLNNDWVNTACALGGAALAVGLWLLAPGWFGHWFTLPGQVSQGDVSMSFPISSTSFEEGGLIPLRYTCDGENRSPALSWRDLPANTRSLALIADDPDAPMGVFTHWVLYNLPPSLTKLAEGQPKGDTIPNIGTQGYNDFRRLGYDGPCPPPGSVHRYYFKLYALDIEPTLPSNLTAAQLRSAMQGHILAESQWVGKFGR